MMLRSLDWSPLYSKTFQKENDDLQAKVPALTIEIKSLNGEVKELIK